jgi:UDP-3-O-[3-hydroxymyristoyl] glucosamine N-acyltransferase
MKLDQTWKAKDIAQLLKAEVIGDGNTEISGINEIHQVEVGDLTFVDIEKYYNACLNSKATAILINKRMTPPEGLEPKYRKGGISTTAPTTLARHIRSLPPILHILYPSSM